MKFARTYSAPGDPYAGVAFEPRTSQHRQPERVDDFRGQGHPDPDRPGVRSRPISSRRSISARPAFRAPSRASKSRAFRSGCGAPNPPTARPSARKPTPARCSTGWPAPGRTGAISTATSRPKTTRASITTRCARCWRARSAPPTPRSGSTPGCIGRTASRARRKATASSTPRRANSCSSTSAYEHPAPHACLPYRALVTTPDGPIAIGDIVTKNLVGLSVYDEVGTTRVVAVKHNGVKSVYRVQLANGNYIEATEDHLVRACDGHKGPRGWRPVSALRPGNAPHSTDRYDDRVLRRRDARGRSSFGRLASGRRIRRSVPYRYE